MSHVSVLPVVFPLADFVIDVHSGDGAEWLAPFVGVYGGPLASEYGLALRVRDLALSLLAIPLSAREGRGILFVCL